MYLGSENAPVCVDVPHHAAHEDPPFLCAVGQCFMPTMMLYSSCDVSFSVC